MEKQQIERNLFQEKGKELSLLHPFLAIEAATGCHELNHPILMFDGTVKKVQDISIGDLIMGNDSTPRKVLNLFKGKEMMYRISPHKGESFVVNENHILSLKRTNLGKLKNNTLNLNPDYLNISIKDYLNLSKYKKHIYKIYKEEVKFSSKILENDDLVYYLGLWLGDGNQNNTGITNIDIEIVKFLYEICSKYQLEVRKKDNRHYFLSSTLKSSNTNRLLQFLQENNLLYNKHIPDKFLFSVRSLRLQLLAGLLDSDGYLYKNTFEICQKRKELLEQIQFLARSLGFYTKLTYKAAKCTNCKDSEVVRPNWRLFIGGDISQIPTKIKRKQSSLISKMDYKKSGFIIEQVGIDNFYGFELDGNHLYLDGYFYVHHNSGKGLCVMKCIEADTSGKKWLVLVPETLQIINLQDDIKKHGMEHIYFKIEDIICYASLHKYEGMELNIWANEAHRLSECKTDISKTIKYQRIIADSATINEDIKSRLKSLGNFHFFKLSLKSAIEKGIIPSPTIYTIGIELNNTIKRNNVLFGKKKFLYSDKEYVSHLDKNILYWVKRGKDAPEQEWMMGKVKNLGSERKKFFAKCKTTALKILLDKIKDKRYVCFTGSTEQCDEIGGKLAVHSKKGKKHNENVLDFFNKKLVSSIYFHKMGREGMNLADIEAVVITQLSTGNDEGLEFLQTSGRSYRATSPEVYVLYVKNSKDEKFLEKALNNVDKKYVKEFKL